MTVDKSYDASTKSVTISEAGSKIAEVQLIHNTDNCITECEALIRIKTNSKIILPSSTDTKYKWDFIKASDDQAGLKSYWFEIQKTNNKNVTDYSEVCNPYDVKAENGTAYTIQNCTDVPTGSHIEYQTAYEPFNFWGETLEADTEYYIKLKGEKHFSLRENNVEWIPTFYGLQISEWAWWNNSFGYKRNDTLTYTANTPLVNFPYVVNASGFDVGNPSGSQFIWTIGNVNGSKWLYYDGNTDYASVNIAETSQDTTEVEIGNGSNYSSSNLIWNGTYSTVYHITRRGSNYIDSALNVDSNLTKDAFNLTGVVGEGVSFKDALTGYNEYSAGSHTVQVAEVGDIFNSENFTLMFWMNTSGIWAPMFFMSKGDDSAGGAEWLFTTDVGGGLTNISFSVRTVGGNSVATLQNNLNNNTWYHIAAVFNKSHVSLYVNGTLAATNATGGNARILNNYNWYWNCRRMSGGDPDKTGYTQACANIIFDEIRYSNKSLSADEIKAAYESTAWRIRTEKFSNLGEQVINDEIIGRRTIEEAINASIPNSTRYEDQQIYIYYPNGTHSTGKFDKVAILGNKTWAFNYVTAGESFTGMSSLLRTVNIWENQSLTTAQIRSQVELFINQTKVG